jgi:Leucine-rich repeat (LRR) protein
MTPTTDLISKLLYKNKDERYRYLIKNSKVHFVEKQTETIYVELPQIPNILIVYRKPEIRVASQGVLHLDDKGLSHIPLLEGEEKLKEFVIKQNKVAKIENLVSLPNLEHLDISSNVIREITNLNSLEKLKTLNLRNNIID